MKVALAIQVLGALLVAGGLAMVAPWAGVLALGVLTLLMGLALEFEGRSGHGPG